MPAVSEKDKSVLTLKKQRDKLKRYRQKCDANAARQQEIARSLYKQGRKDAAIRLRWFCRFVAGDCGAPPIGVAARPKPAAEV